MTDKPFDLEVVDTSGLTDADWAEINRLKRLYETGGRNALSKALAELGESDPLRSIRVLGAFFPETVREALSDSMAEQGITAEDLRVGNTKKVRHDNRSQGQPCGLKASA